MSLISKRLVGIVASTALLSLVSAAANAQTNFHNEFNGVYRDNEVWESNYAFQKPMILNSIGFYTNGESMLRTQFVLNNNYSAIQDAVLASDLDIHGFQWYEIPGGLSMDAGSVLSVWAEGPETITYDEDDIELYRTKYTDLKRTKQPYNFSVQEISWVGSRHAFNFAGSTTVFDVNYTNSNIRVTNPGSNVAPEPGSFALALTGGAALIGICIRRRRNAG